MDTPNRLLRCPRCRNYLTAPHTYGFRIQKANVDVHGQWLHLRCKHAHPFRRGSCGYEVAVDLVAMQVLLAPERSSDGANDIHSIDAPGDPPVA